MIQRIQTIYLLIVTVLGILLCCFPLASIGEVAIKWGQSIVYTGLITIMPAITLATIFLFKKRILQMRFCSFNIILNILTILLVILHIYLAKENSDAELKLFLPTVIMPINIILLYLSVRAIGKDEALVRSLDRLR